MKLINFDKVMRIITKQPFVYAYECGYEIQDEFTVDTNSFSRRTMSQCLTEDYCKGWNDCYDAIMKKLEELK